MLNIFQLSNLFFTALLSMMLDHFEAWSWLKLELNATTSLSNSQSVAISSTSLSAAATSRTQTCARGCTRTRTETNAMRAQVNAVDTNSSSIWGQQKATNGKECIACCHARRLVVFMPCTHVVYCKEWYARQVEVAMEKYQDALNRNEPESSIKVECPICKNSIIPHCPLPFADYFLLEINCQNYISTNTTTTTTPIKGDAYQ